MLGGYSLAELKGFYDYGYAAAKMLHEAEREQLGFAERNRQLKEIRRDYGMRLGNKASRIAVSLGVLSHPESYRYPFSLTRIVIQGRFPLPPWLVIDRLLEEDSLKEKSHLDSVQRPQ